MRPAGVAAVEVAKANGRWQTAYPAQVGMEIPPDFALALANNTTAAANFDQLDAANRDAIMYRLDTVKRPATRERKIVEYIDMLVRGESLHPPWSPQVRRGGDVQP